MHAVNSIIMLLDIFISARPCYLLHFYQPLIAVFCYIIFSVIYWVAGGVDNDGNPYIYSILDWSSFSIPDHPSPLFPLVSIGLLLIPFAYAILWCLHLLRDYLHKLCIGHSLSKDTCYDNEAMENGDLVETM